MDKKKTGVFLSGDSLSEYVYNKLVKYTDVVPFSFEKIHFAKSRTFRFGDIAGILALLKKEGAGQLVMIGRIPPFFLFGKGMHLSGATFLGRQDKWQGESIMASAADFLEKEGINIVPLTTVLKELLAGNKVYTKAKPGESGLKDIRLGAALIKSLLPYRAGQAVAVKKGMVIAVEGVEGTDLMIERAGSYCKNFAVVKFAGRGKDKRFDLPVVGPGTIKVMAKAGGNILAVEAGKTLLLEEEKTVALCNRNGIVLAGIKGG